MECFFGLLSGKTKQKGKRQFENSYQMDNNEDGQ